MLCSGSTSSRTATLTPGGGFQGGVILATALLLVYLAGELLALRRARPIPLVELAEAIGAGAYALIGVGGADLRRRRPRQLPAARHDRDACSRPGRSR